jgi:hypothetical protein
MGGRYTVERSFKPGDASVVYQHIKNGKAFGHAIPIAFGGHIQAGEGCADIIGHGLPGFGVNIRQNHARSLIVKSAGNCSTNPSGTPGYKGDLVL